MNTSPPSDNYNFPVASQTQEEHNNISVFEESDNDETPFTSVKRGPML